MLLGMLTALSSLAAVLSCIVTGAFDRLDFLWLLPVSFAGSFLLLAAAAFGILVLSCALVDPDKPREKDSKYFRVMVGLVAETVISFARIRVETRGLEKTPKSGRFLLVCNHLHEADPMLLLHFFRKSQLAFVSKQENRDMFLVGKIMPMLLCPLINRENDREALKTILRCIHLLKEDKASVAIFPEGYIHEDRKFHQFRPGVFKIAQKAKVPIVVCTIRDTHYVVKNFLKGKPSNVQLHLLDVIPAEALEGRTTVDIAQQIHQMMAEDLGEDYRPAEEEENT